jgi:hypothetical protein
MKIKQTIILLAAFVLPIGIFLFLKTMGKNEFAVEPLHQTGVIQVSTECGIAYQTPYTVPSHVLASLRWSNQDSLTLYVFDNIDFDEKAVTNKLKEANTHPELQMHLILSDSVIAADAEDKDPIIKDAVSIEQMQDCFFILEKDKNAVLVDRQQRIRGYYDLSSREEIDRLVVEIEIILKKY